MDNLVIFSNQKLPLTLEYPNPTPRGCRVTAREQSNDIGYRVHFTSDGSGEIYFEVGQYANLSISTAMDLFKKEVSERIHGLEIGELEELMFDSYPAYRFTIRWPGTERVITFLQKEDMVYRLIYDPSSPINGQILESVRFYMTSNTTAN
jgi:hypothetical protein